MFQIENKFKIPDRHILQQKSVWLEFEELSSKYSPLNLSQNHPLHSPPEFITKKLAEIAKSPNCILHQYTRDYGHPKLVTTLSKLYSPLIGHEIDPESEILTTVGAYEALFASIVGHVDLQDEVIIIEPYYDCYEPMVRFAGGIPKFISLQMKTSSSNQTSEDWSLDKNKLENLFNEKTKVIILNNPHNPSGKVFNFEELEHIAELCRKWNVLCISDEVYEWVVYKPNKHIRIASLSDMWERTITIGSAGKSFNITGWRLGWAYGPSNLLNNLKMVHQNSVYTGNTPMQEVIALAFEQELNSEERDSYFNQTLQDLEAKRKLIIKFLREVNMNPIEPQAGYFLLVDWSPLAPKIDLNSEKDHCKDYRFCKWMVKNIGLLGIPTSAFYSRKHKLLGENFLRFCFFNETETLQEAATILSKLDTKICFD